MSRSPSNIYKALLESAKELKEYSNNENNKYIVCFTDSVDGQSENGDKYKEVLRQFKANLIIIGLGEHLARQDFRHLEELCQAGNEGRICVNPSEEALKELFLSISNYKFQSLPLIYETFN